MEYAAQCAAQWCNLKTWTVHLFRSNVKYVPGRAMSSSVFFEAVTMEYVSMAQQYIIILIFL